MRKFFSKIFTLFLLVSILGMVGDFCFHNLTDNIRLVEIAQAATLDHDRDSCGANHAAKPVTETGHQNSLLSCCSSNTVPGVLSTSSSTTEIIKFIPATFFSGYEPIKMVLNTVSYHQLITSPPELIALRVTTLRI